MSLTEAHWFINLYIVVLIFGTRLLCSDAIIFRSTGYGYLHSVKSSYCRFVWVCRLGKQSNDIVRSIKRVNVGGLSSSQLLNALHGSDESSFLPLKEVTAQTKSLLGS